MDGDKRMCFQDIVSELKQSLVVSTIIENHDVWNMLMLCTYMHALIIHLLNIFVQTGETKLKHGNRDCWKTRVKTT